MATPRERGNVKFTSGDFGAAATAYSEGIDNASTKTSELTVLLSNRAACWLKLSEHEKAVNDCERAIGLDPVAWKAYMRLAQGLHGLQQQEGHLLPMQHAVKLGPAVCAAIALLQPSDPPAALIDLYHAAHAPAPDTGREAVRINLPASPAAIALASSPSDIARAVSRGCTVVVIRPGTYDMADPRVMMGLKGKSYTLLGLGDVTLHSAYSHALYIQAGTVQLHNVRLRGSGQHAAACVAGDPASAAAAAAVPKLVLVGCRVQDYGEVGVLAVGAEVEMADCAFSHLKKQAVECREGAGVVAQRVRVDRCKQGGCRAGVGGQWAGAGASHDGVCGEGIVVGCAGAAGALQNCLHHPVTRWLRCVQCISTPPVASRFSVP